MKIAAKSIELLRHITASGWRSQAVFYFINTLFRLFRPRRKVALDNLAIAFPEKTKDSHKELLNGMYANLSWMIVEQLLLQRDPSMAEIWVDETEGEEYLKEVFSQRGGMVIVTAHFGNSELLLAWGVQRGYPIYAVYRGPNDPDLDELLKKYRSNFGAKMLDRRFEPARTIKLVKLLKSGNFIAIAGDVNEYEGIMLPFFGRNSRTSIGAAYLALLADVPIVPILLFRKAPFSHKVMIGDPIRVPKEGTRQEQAEALTREINRHIENAIKNAPSLWFWMHKRWKE
jgi:KDO2-lipid IV(A) lauroyltransferase